MDFLEKFFVVVVEIKSRENSKQFFFFEKSLSLSQKFKNPKLKLSNLFPIFRTFLGVFFKKFDRASFLTHLE